MTGLEPIRLPAVDDEAVPRDGIAAIVAPEPDMALVGEAANGAEAVEAFHNLRPDMTLRARRCP